MRAGASSPRSFAGLLASLAAATVAASLAGLLLGIRWLTPILDALPAWIFMATALRRGSRARAIGLMLWWAFWLATTAVVFTILAPGQAERGIFNGAAYRDEMLAWISSGAGRESTPTLFIPQHLTHAATFCIVTLATGGALSLVMGAVMMNYMSFYVGALIGQCAGSPAHSTAMLLAWNPWSMMRVVSFVILGVVLAEPLLSSRLGGEWPDPLGRRRWIVIAIAGLVLDLLLKGALAPLWPSLLRGCLH
ncbi:MAG TPA: hypothetical protein VGK94_07720 [Candidatus Polarisedimenticolia bacterium]|jgi:hypothetical protein